MADAGVLWAALEPIERAALIIAVSGAVLMLLWALLRRPPARSEALAEQISALAEGQQRLAGGLAQAASQISETARASQAETLRQVEERLATVTDRLGGSVASVAEKTAQSMGDLAARLESIDRAQANLEKLSGDVLGLQEILANKQTRGAFGEIQLNDLIAQTLPPDAYRLQATLSNGRRADALLKLPHPPGPIAVDAKFPLEGYEALAKARAERDAAATLVAERAFRAAVKKHLADIAERYIVPEETADGALMFLPSEAVYAELHARFPEVVREGFEARVYVVSPTTLMATLHTVRAILKDARIRDQADAVRRELSGLARDVAKLAERAGAVRSHVAKTDKDLAEIDATAGKALARLERIEGVEAAPLDGPETGPPLLPRV
ncbi:MAG: DNA recombination protein RmuC [Pseudomonadota bacterium]